MPLTSTKNDKLTAKEVIFVAEYLKDHNGSRAAKIAGYKQPSIQAVKILKRKRVHQAILKEDRTLCKKAKIEAQDVLRQLSYAINRDIADYVDEDGCLLSPKKIPKHARALIDGYEVIETFDPEGNRTVRTKIKLTSKLGAIDLAMKHKGLFASEKVTHTHKHEVDWDEYYKPQRIEDPIQRRIELAQEGRDEEAPEEVIDAEYTISELVERGEE